MFSEIRKSPGTTKSSRKLGRLPVLKRYTVLDVPNGNALGPKELYKRYFGYTEEQRIRANTLLMRNYLTNFDRPAAADLHRGRLSGGKDPQARPR